MNGIETMIKTLLKAMGFDPNQFIEGMQGFMSGVQGTLKTCMDKLSHLEASLARIEMNQFHNHTEIVVKLEEMKPSVPPCVLEPAFDLNPISLPDNIAYFDQIQTTEKEAA